MALTAEERKARKREQARASYYLRREEILQSKRENKDRHNEKRRERKARIRELVAELKDIPCMDCGGKFPPCCMDFDHIGDNKVAGVSNLVSQNYSFEIVVSEIEKCELVCANCHRIRTYERRANNETRSDSFKCSPV